MDINTVITFTSTHAALKAEDIFKELNLDFELVPTPREISAECGFSLLVYALAPDKVHHLCQQNKVKFDAIYKKSSIKGVFSYEKNY